MPARQWIERRRRRVAELEEAIAVYKRGRTAAGHGCDDHTLLEAIAILKRLQEELDDLLAELGE